MTAIELQTILNRVLAKSEYCYVLCTEWSSKAGAEVMRQSCSFLQSEHLHVSILAHKWDLRLQNPALSAKDNEKK